MLPLFSIMTLLSQLNMVKVNVSRTQFSLSIAISFAQLTKVELFADKSTYIKVLRMWAGYQ